MFAAGQSARGVYVGVGGLKVGVAELWVGEGDAEVAEEVEWL